MSDTAKELRLRLNTAMDESWSERMTAYYRIAGVAIDRLAQLERGIERANRQAVGFGDVNDTRIWYSHDELMREGSEGGVAPREYESLMQLIEELGNEQK